MKSSNCIYRWKHYCNYQFRHDLSRHAPICQPNDCPNDKDERARRMKYDKRCIYRTSTLVDDHKGKFEHKCSNDRRINDPCIGEAICPDYQGQKDDRKETRTMKSEFRYCKKCDLSQPVGAYDRCSVCGAEITKAERLHTYVGQKAMPFHVLSKNCMHCTELGDRAFCDARAITKPNEDRCTDTTCPIWAGLDDAQPMECRE